MRFALTLFALLFSAHLGVAAPTVSRPLGGATTPGEPRAEAAGPVQKVENRLVGLAERYRTGNRSQKLGVLRQLVGSGQSGADGLAGLRLAATLAGSEESTLRVQALRQVRWGAREGIARDIVSGSLDSAQATLEALSASGDSEAYRDLAAFHALTGRELDPGAEPELLAWTLRARGELDRALAVAEDAGLTEAREALLLDRGAWDRLAALGRQQGGDDARALGLQALLLQLAGREAEAAEALSRLKDRGVAVPDEARDVAAGLILNGRPIESVPFLEQAGELATAFDILDGEQLHSRALDLLAPSRLEGLDESARATLKLRAARSLERLAEGQRARETVAELSGLLPETARGASLVGRVIGNERALGLEEEARAHAVSALAALPEGGRSGSILGGIYPRMRQESSVAWSWLREQRPEEPIETTLSRIDDLLSGSADVREVAELVRGAGAFALELPANEMGQWMNGLLELAELHELDGAALELTQGWAASSGRPDAWLRYGELLVSAERWTEAAAAFHASWEANPIEAGPVALEAWALQQAGRLTEAESRRQAAALLPLGDGSRRYRLAQLLARERLDSEAHAQRLLTLDLSDPTGWYHGATLRVLAQQDRCAGNLRAAAELYEAAVVQAFTCQSGLRPANARCLDRGLRDLLVREAVIEGELERAVRLGGQELRPWLVALDRTADFVNELESEGLTAEADWLAWRVFQRLESVARDFPEAGRHHNSVAWFAARTRRELPAALAAAERATALRPSSAGWTDTLAEVRFQLGETERAVELMDRALALAPDSEYLAAQRQRFLDGDATTRPPVGK